MRLVIDLIAAARPNFMKIAPVYHALRKEPWCSPRIIHTGQHYDKEMSAAFFEDLELPDPDIHLNVGSGTHAEQTAGVMVAYERICKDARPAVTLVVGDVNSTLACALAAKKILLPVAHLEAGLRSGDRTMPEEINRIVTDAISDLLLTPSPDADANLRREGVPRKWIVRVGNIMIDAYELMKPKIGSCRSAARLGLNVGGYGVVTIHRPSNVDDRQKLSKIVDNLVRAGRHVPLVFPVHPRTRNSLETFNLLASLEKAANVHVLPALGYVDFMSLVSDSKLVITDSGGIQEETTYLGIPCLTLRDTTERPVTIEKGTNMLVKDDELIGSVLDSLEGPEARRKPIPLWDGHTSARVTKALKAFVGTSGGV